MIKGQLIRAYFGGDGDVWWDEWTEPEMFAKYAKEDPDNVGYIFGEPIKGVFGKCIINAIHGGDEALMAVAKMADEFKQMQVENKQLKAEWRTWNPTKWPLHYQIGGLTKKKLICLIETHLAALKDGK